jgi:predicted transcriptional regulator
MTARRSKLEIYLNVLQIVKSGTEKPTRIMYAANLSWKPLQKILDGMTAQGLINGVEAEDGDDKRTTKIYEITQKGENVLKYFVRAKELLPLEEIIRI